MNTTEKIKQDKGSISKEHIDKITFLIMHMNKDENVKKLIDMIKSRSASL